MGLTEGQKFLWYVPSGTHILNRRVASVEVGGREAAYELSKFIQCSSFPLLLSYHPSLLSSLFPLQPLPKAHPVRLPYRPPRFRQSCTWPDKPNRMLAVLLLLCTYDSTVVLVPSEREGRTEGAFFDKSVFRFRGTIVVV